MSIAVMSKVWSKSQHKGNALLLLLAIADNADDSGWCWPGIEYLAKKVKVTPQSIIRTTKTLKKSGELTVLHNRRRGNKYVVRLGLSDSELETVLRDRAPYLDEKQISNILLCNAHDTSRSNVDDTSEVTPVLDEPPRTVNEPSFISATAETPQLDLHIEELPKSKRKRKPRDNALYGLARVLAEVCVIDYDSNRPKVFAEAKRLSGATPTPTPELVRLHYSPGKTWYKKDWRGKKGQPPPLGQVRLTWAQFVTDWKPQPTAPKPTPMLDQSGLDRPNPLARR